METVPTDFGKRVYQGVRVKHTVKDLLAEKRSRQSSGSHLSGSTSTPQSAFVQVPGSPPTSYYGVRRPFPAELDFHSTKQFVSDVYSSPVGSKPFSCDSSASQGYPALLDSYLSDQCGDYHAPPLAPGASSFFSPSAVPPLLPSFPGDTGHFLLVSWTPAIPGAQPYPLHPLEDAHCSPSSPYTFSPFTAVGNEPPSRMSHLCPEQSSETPHLQDNPAWAKEDGSALWGTYEGRRTY
ncbi:uncharacterized protein C11orf53 homolog [Manacus vitellinus]|uniref:uncharacterized protein C11orf53 homolog n=1 Tax=Manacus vitellinus TaxID=328815 RepID=UPI00115CB456|nr:uncharacterized protein C11orf53 homolog [Manacus vitellinus]